MRYAGSILAAGVAAVVISACGSTAAPQDSARSQTQPTVAAPATPVARTRQRVALAVLRTPRGPSARLAEVRQLVPKSLIDRFGIDFSSARFATVARAQPIFVVRGASAYCLVDRARSLTNCWGEERTRAGKASVTSLCSPRLTPGTIEVGGLVPNGVRTVTILRGGRFADKTVGVRNNVFVAVLPMGNPLPLWLRWNGDGPRHSTGVPVGTRYKACGAIRSAAA